MPNVEFALLFYVINNGEEDQYHYKVDAIDENSAIEKAPDVLRAVEKQLCKKVHCPMLVKVLLRSESLGI